MSEHQEQALVFQWAETQIKEYPELRWLYAIPNGGKRDKITAAILKREGVKPGVHDICLPCSRGGFNALYVEMKRLKPIVRSDNSVRMKETKLSKEQEEWRTGLELLGNCVVVCYTAEQAERALLDYLNSRYLRASA